MQSNQIMSSLQEAFNEPLKDGEERKLVFWTDIDKEFVDDFNNVQIENVKTIHLHKHNQFYAKHLLEEEDPTSSYLIYTNMDLQSRENWLYDTVLYSKVFYADRLSLIMSDLQIDYSFRAMVQQYAQFFKSKDRTKRLKSFAIQTYTKELIELAIMNVICKTQSLDFETVLRKVLMDTLDDENNRYLYDIERYFDIDTFWNYVEKEYNYTREKKTLRTLCMHLSLTALSRSVDEKYLSNFSQFIAEYNRTNAFVFIDHWMNHKEDYKKFNDYMEEIEEEIRLADTLNQLPIEVFQEGDIFPYIDRAVIIYIANSLLNQQEDYESHLGLINRRRTKHFYDKYRYLYEALFFAVKMQAFKKEYAYGIPESQAVSLYQAYVKEYYLMDTYYRKFYLAYDAEGPSDILSKLKPLIENLYTNWFHGELSTNWSQAVKNEMTNDWSLSGVRNQQHFYTTFIAPHVHKNERVFVIISDAMRYEVGKELQERLNTEIMGDCEMESMISVVPSVTKLGMAALLPHNQLEINERGQVLVNGQNSSGLENRNNILKSYSEDSIAIHFEDVFAMNKTGRREKFKGKKLIYIYHDAIDAIGDNAATESGTFQAVEQALDELSNLVRIIRNDLSGTYLYITADHGFLFQKDDLRTSDLLQKESIDALEIKRRYMLSREQKELPGQFTTDLSSIIENEPNLYAYVPNATIRYRIQGAGSKFVHGGASLQEVSVPLLKIKNKRAGQRGAESSQKVDIHLTSTTRQITNSIFALDFFQTEKIADKITPRKVVVYITDEKDQALSNKEIIIGDLTSSDPKERVFNIQFALKRLDYDRNMTYYLVIKDTETDVIIDKIPFTINLGIISDFDF
ncbi:BREX-1 system phosphatase PglZ type A [Cerasibacillus terrae]|uniref:BREX-1 system phosphatase PglZ type A n=1 Tax=Cerasibacillus terrae TaxID=2498845 RepID=A0A5C8NRY7_9BACI|nr:BREX-1 system phosphatase PglZ type A [Cerasibacillus terrae]TXL64461.1 BREX-1 system phosphatase PglZ type A [Cerasibacillus terrae]